MALIQLRSSFTLIPEGTHTFVVESVEYDEKFGNVRVNMKTQNGYHYTERFFIMDANGEPSEKGLNAFSFFYKTVMNNFSYEEGEEVEPNDMVGHYIKMTIVHRQQPSKKDPSKMVTFANSTEKSVSDGWDIQKVEKTSSTSLLDGLL